MRPQPSPLKYSGLKRPARIFPAATHIPHRVGITAISSVNAVAAAATSTTGASTGLMAAVMTDEGMATLCPGPDECSLAIYLTGLLQAVIYLLASSEMSSSSISFPTASIHACLFTAPASKLGLAKRWCMHVSLLISFLFN